MKSHYLPLVVEDDGTDKWVGKAISDVLVIYHCITNIVAENSLVQHLHN